MGVTVYQGSPLSFPEQEIGLLVRLRTSWSAEKCQALKDLGSVTGVTGRMSFDHLVMMADTEISAHLMREPSEPVRPGCVFRDLLCEIEAKWRLPLVMAFQRAAREGIEDDIVLIPTAPLCEDSSGGFKRMAFRLPADGS